MSPTISQSNEPDFETVSKKRKQHHLDDRHTNHRLSKKRRPSSPSVIYSFNRHRSRNFKYHRRSSSLSTRSSDNNQHSPIKEYDQTKLMKGTLGSELDKLRPKIDQDKTNTTLESQTQINDHNVRLNFWIEPRKNLK